MVHNPATKVNPAVKFCDHQHLVQIPLAQSVQQKSALVDLGLAALAEGDWVLVETITHLIQNGGHAHE
jgi:hypothetical protein